MAQAAMWPWGVQHDGANVVLRLRVGYRDGERPRGDDGLPSGSTTRHSAVAWPSFPNVRSSMRLSSFAGVRWTGDRGGGTRRP